MSELLAIQRPTRRMTPVVKKNKSLAEMIDMFIKTKGELAPVTIIRMNCLYAPFIAFMQGRTINEESLSEWLIDLRTTKYKRRINEFSRKPATINLFLAKVRGLLRWLHRVKYLPEDYRHCIQYVKAPATDVNKIFSYDEYLRMLAWCAPRPRYHLMRWLIILGYRTGMSLVDCCHLRWCHVHLDDNGPSFIEVPRRKTGHLCGASAISRIPVLPGTELHRGLLERREMKPSYTRFDGVNDYVHEDAPGHYLMGTNLIRHWFSYIMKKCGVKKDGRSFKNFRNTFISNLINSGLHPALVCKMVGHSNIKMMLRYLKPDNRAMEDGLLNAYRYAQGEATSLDLRTTPNPSDAWQIQKS